MVHSDGTTQLKAPTRVRSINSAAYIRARVNGRTQLCLLDSGADICIIPTQWVDRNTLQSTNQTLVAANGTPINSDGRVQLKVTADGLALDTDFITSPNVDEIILGRDWLSRHHVT